MASCDFPVAVIGMAVNLPAAKTCNEFWSMMINGEESVGQFPSERSLDIQHVLDPFRSELLDKDKPFFTGSFFIEVDKFDPKVFQISEKEALYIEPEQRIFLQTVWELLEDAGYASRIRGSKTGVYVGNTVNKYKYILTDNHPSISHGNHSPFISARVSYVLDLKGPAMMVATGCSSSLLSVHLACQGLLSGDCDMAIAGGITLDLLPISTRTDIWNQLGITGPEVKCRPFDISANGIAKGEGCGAVMLKPLDKAIADNDYIYGVLEGTTANQDGHSNGITAPHPGAQTDMLVQAWKLANITPDKISYFEAHGTGTELGDPIEISGITKAFKKCGLTFNCQTESKIPIGSVKANVGHLADGAAGIVGLIKVLLCLKHNIIPPSVHFKEPNPHINWPASPVFVNTSPITLAQDKPCTPMYISLSAFGLLGTNVHSVVKKYLPPLNSCDDHHHNKIHFVALAANSKWSLSETCMKMMLYFESESISTNRALRNFCYTVNTGRQQKKFQHRAIAFGSNWSEMSQSLKLLHHHLQQETPSTSTCEPTYGYATVYDLKKLNRDFLMNVGEQGRLMLSFIDGKNISWDSYYSNACVQYMEKLPLLPTYAFEKERYWPEMSSIQEPLNAKYLTLEYGTRSNLLESKGSSIGIPSTVAVGDDPTTIEIAVKSALNEALHLSMDWNEYAAEDLFSYGLDSLISTQINMHVKRELGVSFSMKGFHLNPTYEGIISMIQTELKSMEPSNSKQCQVICSPRIEPDETNPISFAQQRLWVMQELTSNHCVYNATNCLKITGDFHVSAFVAAVNSTLSSHDAFYIIFSERSHKPTQTLNKDCQLFVKEVSIDGSAGDSPHNTAMELYRQDYKMPFDLQKGPLVRCFLYHLPEDNSHYFTMVIHHIIFDGWSHFLFYNELWDKYKKIIEGTPISSQLHAPLFIDLAGKEYAYSLSSSSEDLAYWKSVLSGDLPLTTLPGDRKRPTVFSHNGKRLTSVIDNTIIKSIQDACDSKYTVFMILLSCVYTLIYSFTGEKDLIVGSPIAGRTYADSKHVIGCFVNTLALRIQIGDQFSFKDVLENVFGATLEALDHQNLPFDFLVNHLNLSRDTSITPVFSINVCYHNTEIKSEHVDPPKEVRIDRILLHNDSAKWDLYFDFLQEDHGMTFTLEYYSDLYSDGYANHIVNTFLSLLKSSLVTQPSITLNELHFSNSVSVLHGDSKDLGTSSLPLQLLKKMRQCSDLSYILDEHGKKHEYGDVLCNAMKLSLFLRKTCMLREQTRIGLLLDPSLEGLKSVLACVLSGLVYVPLNRSNPRRRLELICREAQLQVIVFAKTSISLANHLLWSCKTAEILICIDSDHFFEIEDSDSVPLMDKELWHSVATSATNDVEGGGWKSSYTGNFMSIEEMKEYSDNVLTKLRPYIKPSTHILEIGCASGLTTKVLSPLVSRYVATDISQAMVDKIKEKLHNIETACLPADQISSFFNNQTFDIIILNSVVHCFPGHNYLWKVFSACESLLSENGVIFMGDIMDFDLKDKLIHSLQSYKKNKAQGRKVKTEWENELFLTRDFLNFLCHKSTKLHCVSYSQKIHTISNELTQYRFDAVYTTDKHSPTLYNVKQKMYALSEIKEATSAICFTSLYETCLKTAQVVNFNNPAYILFTSGTTGMPKGVIIGHGALLNYVQWAASAYKFDQSTVTAFFSPLTFDFTITSIFPPMLAGSNILIFKNFQESYFDIMTCQDITTLKLSPLQLDTLLANTDRPLSASTFIIGGEELTTVLLNKLKCNKKAGKFQVWNEYGPTEATVGCIVKCFFSDDLPLDQNEFVSIGQPIDNATISVVRDNCYPILTGSKGTLCIGGKCLCSDIIGSQSKRFVAASWGRPGEMMLITDDVVQVVPNSLEVFYYGRDGDSNTAKVNDIRVDLREVENAIQTNSFINSAWVTTFKYKSHTYLGAAMIPSKIPGLKDLELREAVSVSLIQTLPKEFIPKVFIVLSQPPLTANGKKDLPLLKKLFVNHMASSPKESSEKLSQSSVVTKLQHIWQSVLPINHIPQPEENFFFELCGDSLQAIYLVRKLRDEGYKVDITDIFTYPSIKQLSPVLSQRGNESKEKSVPVHSFRPTPIVEEFLICSKADQYALSALLLFNPKPEFKTLKQALKSVANKHMSLHSKFEVCNGRAQQEVVDITDEHLFLIELDIIQKKDELVKEPEFFSLCESLELKLSLSEGILMNAAIISYCANEVNQNYVLIVVHHIALDMASWHQILSDLAKSFELLSNDDTCVPDLPECVTPFSCFCSALYNEVFESEIPYWKEIEALSQDDSTISNSQNLGTYASAKWCSAVLDVSCIHSVTSSLKCSDEVLILTMFGRSLNSKEKHIITLESHGRQLSGIDSTDTVGWCTSKFPFVLDTAVTGNPIDQIKRTQEAKAKIPNHGLGFGILKSSELLTMNYPKIMFVFQGHLDTATNKNFSGGKFSFELVPWLEVLSDDLASNKFHRQPSDVLQFDLEVISWVYKGKLNIGCLFNSDNILEETVQEILDLTILNIKFLAHKVSKAFEIGIEVLSTITITPECASTVKESLFQHGIAVSNCVIHPPEQILQQLNQGQFGQNESIAIIISRFQNQQLAEDFNQICNTSKYLKNGANVIIIDASTVPNSVHHPMNEIRKSITVCSLPEYISNCYYESDTDTQYGMPFTQVGYSHFGLYIARAIHGKVSKPKYKVIVVDADYTLWNGECAEGNVNLNEANTSLHKFLMKMKHKGMLLAILSKNNLQDVENTLMQTMKTSLTCEDFVFVVANWNPKSDNIKDIAAKLNLGLDSFVFIDDSILECEQMQRSCPEVLTIQFPSNSNSLVSALLDNLWALDSFNVSLEGATRTEMYKSEIKRQEDLQAHHSEIVPSHILYTSWNMKLKICKTTINFLMKNDQLCNRASELLFRTNQFKLNNVKLNLHDFQHDHQCWLISLEDRFGSYGIVSVILLSSNASVEQWVLSCRALGREIEGIIIHEVGKQIGGSIQMVANSTGRNIPCLQFLRTFNSTLEFTEEPRHVCIDPHCIKTFDIHEVHITSDLIGFSKSVYSKTISSLQQTTDSRVELSNNLTELHVWIKNNWSPLQVIMANFHNLFPILPICDALKNPETVNTTSSNLESSLKSIWMDVLQSDAEPKESDSFLLWGGDSFKAVFLISKLRRESSIDINIMDLFQNPEYGCFRKAVLKASALSHKTAILDDKPTHHADADEDQTASLLSHGQQRMVVMQITSPLSSSYTETIAVKVSTTSQPDQIFKALVQMHPILNSRIIKLESSYLMYVKRELEFDFDVMKILDVKTAEKILSDTIPVINVISSPLVKFRCIELEDNTMILAVHVHHVVADEVTLHSISQSLIKIANMNVISLPLVQLQNDYSSFVSDEKSYMESQQRINDCEFWKTYFDCLPPKVSLAILPENETVWSNTEPYKAKHWITVIPKEIQNKILSYCALNDITPYRYFLAITILVLHKYCGVDTVAMAIPLTLRTDLNQNTDGLFINTVLFKATVDMAVTLNEHIQNISKNWLEVQSHSQYPLDLTVKMLWEKHGSSTNSFCCTMFNYSSLNQVQGSIPVLSKHAKMPLSIDVFDNSESLTISIEWAAEMIGSTILQGLANSLKKIYCSAFNVSQQPICSLDLLSTSERSTIESFQTGSKHMIPSDEMAIDIFEKHTTLHADELAITCDSASITYAQLNQIASNLAYDLISKVDQKKLKDKPVILLMRRDAYAVATMLGVWKAGGHFLPVSISNQANLKNVIEQISPVAIIYNSQQDSESLSDEILCPMIDIYTIPDISCASLSQLTVQRTINDVAYIIRTSGSTGRPKQCFITQRSISVISNAWKVEYKMDEFRIVILQWAPFSFDVFIGDLLRGLVSVPGKLIICPDMHRLDVKHVLHLIKDHQITMSEVTPQFGHQLAIAADKTQLESLKILILGSDVLQCHIYEKIRSLLRPDQRLINSYGMTEATIDSSYFEGNVLPITRSGAVPIGKPLPGVNFHILNSSTLQVCPIGTTGELFISGNVLASGDTTIVQPPQHNVKCLKTGDAACWLPCGNVDLLGRLDSMLKLRGFRISTTEIENKIVQHVSGVKDVCIVIKSSKETDFLCAFLVVYEGIDDTTIDQKVVHDKLRTHLPYYMLPDFVRIVHEIPLTDNGKINYGALPSLTELLKSGERVAPSTSSTLSPTILKLKALFASSLGLPDHKNIDCDLTFMEQGANSLVLIQFSSLIAADTNFEVGIADIFSYPSVNALADFVDAKSANQSMNDDFSTALSKGLSTETDIAITGIGIRLPGGIMSLAQLWETLLNGKDLITDFPTSRAKDVIKCLSSASALASIDTFQGAFLEHIDKFDHLFFKLAPGEAKFMSPEQRLFLQVATESLLEARGLSSLKGAKVGVFVASSEIGYSQLDHPDEPIAIAGLMPGMIATRLAYQWDLKGSTMLVDTACSSALTALKLACESIKKKECDGAIVGGVSIVLYPSRTGVFGNASILSPDFHCKPFDNRANGTAVGEGVLCMYLEPLSQAIANKKNVYGIVKSTQSNSVGHGNGITAPSAISQEEVIKKAFATANIDKSDISHIECHGTGTKIGDEIELSALASVFAGQKASLPIGSVKSYFGHLDAAAGLLGVFKVIASLMFNKIPPTANFVSPHKMLVESCLSVSSHTKEWLQVEGKPRIAGVSAFGLTGTNCHSVISEAATNKEDNPENSLAVSPLYFSGADIKQIKQQIRVYSSYIKSVILDNSTNVSLISFCYTIASRLEELHRLGIGHEQFRMVILAKSPDLTLQLLLILSSCETLNCMAQLSMVRNDIYVSKLDAKEVTTSPYNQFLAGGVIDLASFPESVCKAPGVMVPMYQEFSHWLDSTSQPTQNLPSLFSKMIVNTREMIRTLNFEPTEELLSLQNRFCSSIIIQYFLSTGLEPYLKNSETLNFSTAFSLSSMLSKYEKLFFVMLRELYNNNLLVAAGTNNSMYHLDAIKFSCETMLDSSPELINEIAVQKYPQWADCFRFPLYCSRKLQQVLQGKLDPLSVIYPKGDLKFMYQFDKLGDLLGDVYYNMYMQLIASHAKQLSNQQKKVRILEVGAGVGYVTRQLLPKLKDIPNIEYWFTDLGKSFVENAKNLFKDYLFMMKFSTFDITKSPTLQGVIGSFDIVISYNVIHTTESITKSVLNLKTCLGNDGSLYIIESAKNETWATLAWGILDGWWYFKDYDLRPFEPMLEPDKWEKVLENIGFGSVYSCPVDDKERKHVEKFLFLCSAKKLGEDIDLHSKGWWENETAQFDPRKKHDELDKEEDRNDSKIVYTSTQQIIEELHRIWCEVLGIDSIGYDDSFSACGGESLLAIQMMNHVHKRLGFQMEIADTYGYPTLGALATFIAKELDVGNPLKSPVVLSMNSSRSIPSQKVDSGLLLMFPGQGAQKMSMFQTMKKSSEAKAIFRRAERIIGYDILNICIAQGEALQEKMKSTEFVQVALLTGSIAKMEQLKIEKPDLIKQITHVAGLSVGEFAALVYANVLNFEDALKLVQYRGQAMEHEVNTSATGMVSIFGPESQQLQNYISAHFPDMKISTFLGDNQHTIAGIDEDCDALISTFSETKIKEEMNVIDVRKLRVAGAFHSSYMKNAAAKVNPIIDKICFSDPDLPVIMNFDGNITTTPEDIKEALKEQIVAPVQWRQSILTAFQLGVRNFVEVAPGRVLSSIVKKRISECSGCDVTFIEV